MVLDPNQAVPAASAPADPNAAPAANAAPVANAVAPAAPAAASNETPPAANATDEPGSEPELGAKGVEELKTQRKKRQEAEREAEYWRGVAEGRAAQPPAQPAAETAPQGPPQIDQFESYDDFLVAKAKYEFKQEEREENEKKQRNVRVTTYNERFAKAAQKIPDLPKLVHRMINNPAIPQNAAVVDAIMESEVGPEIAHHLATNIEDAIRIGRMSYAGAAYEMGKIAARLTSAAAPAPTNHISQAPEPVKPVGNSGAVASSDYDKMSTEDFMKKRNEETRVKRG